MAFKGKVKVNLKTIHDSERPDWTAYAVSKASGVTVNTVEKYIAENGVVTQGVSASLMRLIKWYGRDWRDKAVVEDVEESKALLATA